MITTITIILGILVVSFNSNCWNLLRKTTRIKKLNLQYDTLYNRI